MKHCWRRSQGSGDLSGYSGEAVDTKQVPDETRPMPPTINRLAARYPRRDPPRWIVGFPLLVVLGCQGDSGDGSTSPPRQHRAAVTVTEECQLVQGEVAKLRTPTGEAEAQAAADALRAEHPHADIPLELLIQEVGPLPG